MNYREISDKQEKRIERDLKKHGVKKVKNSGGNMFLKGDVVGEDIFIEGKTKAKPSSSHTLKKEWWDKMKEQGRGKKYRVLAFDFGDGQDKFILEKDDFLYLYNYAKTLETIVTQFLNDNLEDSIIDTTEIGKLKQIIREGVTK